MKPVPGKKVQIAGWILFIASALCFTGSTWRSGDLLGLSGSLLFLFACFFFMAVSQEIAAIAGCSSRLESPLEHYF